MMDLNCVKILLIFVLVGSVMLGSVFTSNNTYAALKDPIGVAVDPSGNVFTGELRKNIIQKFTNTGKFIRQWETEGARLATDSSGNVYVVGASGNARILKYTNTGKFITQWDSLNSGTSIAVDSSDNIYTIGSIPGSENINTRILKFTNTGTFIKEWNTRHFDEANDVAVDPSNGNVFITANTIQKFSNDGKFIREWGSGYSIAVDKSGNVFVTTNNLTGNYDHVEKYTNTGKFIRKWGSTGTDKGQFDKPGDITVDSKGYVFVADTGMDRIQKFSNTGKFIREWGHVRGGGGNITATSSSLSPSPSPSISSVPMDMGTGAPLALQ
jgi:tripartite motif-containing protein 71